jgi:hypothetical protein
MAELKGKSNQPMQHRTDDEALPFSIDDNNYNSDIAMSDNNAFIQQARTEDRRTQVDKMPAVEPCLKRFAEQYPGSAGTALRRGQTRLEELRVRQEKADESCWAPFASRDEWELAAWLMKNVGQKSTDEFLKLPFVSVQIVILRLLTQIGRHAIRKTSRFIITTPS